MQKQVKYNGEIVYKEHFLYPASLFVSSEPYRIVTVLGSCVAVCIWDSVLRIGGMNHFMVPFWNGDGLASPKYGNIAIPKLVEEMMAMGSQKRNMVVKVFGGGNVVDTISRQYAIGERNIRIAMEMLSELNLTIAASSLGGIQGRKIMFDSYTGEVWHKFLEKVKVQS